MLSSHHLRTIKFYVEVFPSYLDRAGLSSDVSQQLEQQVAAAYEQLAGLLEAMQPAAGAAASAVTTINCQPKAAAAAQQLDSMAQAVISRISLSTACNNPGCSNLAQRSELVLVGGKSCVCARCKAAR
jgi:hypothetical protein